MSSSFIRVEVYYSRKQYRVRIKSHNGYVLMVPPVKGGTVDACLKDFRRWLGLFCDVEPRFYRNKAGKYKWMCYPYGGSSQGYSRSIGARSNWDRIHSSLSQGDYLVVEPSS